MSAKRGSIAAPRPDGPAAVRAGARAQRAKACVRGPNPHGRTIGGTTVQPPRGLASDAGTATPHAIRLTSPAADLQSP
jgi:hypothetical protein